MEGIGNNKQRAMNRDIQIVEMFRNGLTLREIARNLDTSHSVISKTLDRLGINRKCTSLLHLRSERYKSIVGPKISESKKSLFRSSSEKCIVCLSAIGLGRRVITRIMGLPDGMAANVLRKYKVSHPRKFWDYQKLSSKPADKLRRALKDRVRGALRGQGARKNQSIVELLGCSIQEFRKRMEDIMPRKFSWENYGKVWHLDHIIPCAKFDLTRPEEVAICFHWTNYRPLEAKKNISEKHRKGIHQQQLLRI